MTAVRPSTRPPVLGLLASVVALGVLAVGCGAGSSTPAATSVGSSVPSSATSPGAPPMSGSPVPGPPVGSSPSGAASATTTVGAPSAVDATREVRSYSIDGLDRRAIVRVPDIATGAVAPLVFVFHGHGGSGTTAERSFPVPDLWPEAIVVYPDGLVGHQGVTDPEGVKPGWQAKPGELGDRDVHFFDAMLADLTATLPVAGDQIYVMGHSNGAQFSAVLWNQRGSGLAAVAMSSAPVLRNIDGAPPKPLFLSMGRSDTTATFAVQEAGIAPAQALLGVDVSAAATTGNLTTYPGPDGLELAVDIHDGGHDMPDSVLPEIVSFLQRHRLTATS